MIRFPSKVIQRKNSNSFRIYLCPGRDQCQIPVLDLLCKRSFQTTPRKCFWEPYKGEKRFPKEDKLTDFEHVKRGAKMLLPEFKKLLQELRENFAQDNLEGVPPYDGQVVKYFTFNGPESLQNWATTCDSDWDLGYSTAKVSISAQGTGLFTGVLSTEIPKSGEVNNAGYTNLRYIPPLRSFLREKPYVFVQFTHLVLRVRGDGRTYMVNLHPQKYIDISMYNVYSYVLHTRGGPYWQETKIPFSKFFMHYKGRVHDDQTRLELSTISNFSITLADRKDGPFHLEIDYVGCWRDDNHTEEFAYEQYYVPKWSGRN